MTNMPDLPMDKQLQEQRRVIKFWVEHAKKLEKEVERLKEELMKYRGY